MRADFWGECARYTALKERMQARQELIAPMNVTELRAAMEQQAAKVAAAPRFTQQLSRAPWFVAPSLPCREFCPLGLSGN
jgi:hypothetical protein